MASVETLDCACDLLVMVNGTCSKDRLTCDYFHIGIRDSQGSVAEFASFGLRSGRESQSDWQQARPVRLFTKMCRRGLLKPCQMKSFNLWWDHTLKLMFETPKIRARFNADTYAACDHNCFTFVLAFLKALRIKSLDPWLVSRSAFTQEYLVHDLKACQRSFKQSIL